MANNASPLSQGVQHGLPIKHPADSVADCCALSAPRGSVRILTAQADGRTPSTGWSAVVIVETAHGRRTVPMHFRLGQWRSESFQLPTAAECNLRITLRRRAKRRTLSTAWVVLT